MIVKCAYCSKDKELFTSQYNRALSRGNKIYCNKKCSGLGRRDNRSIEEKKKEKAIYDKEYRIRTNKSKKQLEKYHKELKENPEKIRAIQKKHRESQKLSGYRKKYISSERYKKYKHEYDVKRQAKKSVPDEFVESLFLLRELEAALRNSNIRDETTIRNKCQKRKKLKLKSL